MKPEQQILGEEHLQEIERAEEQFEEILEAERND